MSKFILISVCDREILTEVFDSHNEALTQRNKEMIEWAHVPEEVFRKYNEKYEESDFGFDEYQAWANDRCDFDWLIVEVPADQGG